ncbi:uncharacterized protein LOC128321215 [Pangasianodon hypophthalmus]|uniref:uncharacterized protein LOC128321215 n=1 Tax=Pangasianodon hypophthalmus TaxID=310915 RepID=UPI002307E5A2|nr:uncharacterized protein LOC128321215 [Pangasianodon hypophthalmus]
MLLIDFSSTFYTVIPQHLIGKLNLLGLNTSLCNWILDFLTGRPQSVRIGNSINNTTTLTTGAPQGCALSPLVFTLLTHDCVAMHSSSHIIKCTDDTTVVGLITKNNESTYRKEVQRLTDWCRAPLGSLFLPSQTFTPDSASAKPPALWLTPRTPHTKSSPSYRLAKGTQAFGPSRPDCVTQNVCSYLIMFNPQCYRGMEPI